MDKLYKLKYEAGYYDEFMESVGQSNCCDAPVYAEIKICSDCKEHCDIVNPDDED